MTAIYDADAFVYDSRILESWAGSLNPSLEKSKLQVLEVSVGMQLDKVVGLEEVSATYGVDEKTLYGPHTLLDPNKVAEEVQFITQLLSNVDGKNAINYKKNATKFLRRLKNLAGSIKEFLMNLETRPLFRNIQFSPILPSLLV